MLDRILNATLHNNVFPLGYPWFTPASSPPLITLGTQGWTHILGIQRKHAWLIVKLRMKAGWWDAPLAFRDLAEATSGKSVEKICCNLSKIKKFSENSSAKIKLLFTAKILQCKMTLLGISYDSNTLEL